MWLWRKDGNTIMQLSLDEQLQSAEDAILFWKAAAISFALIAFVLLVY